MPTPRTKRSALVNRTLPTTTQGAGGETAFIHAIGLAASDYAAMAAKGTGLIWSPRSDILNYGNTAVVTTASRLGVVIALGTDWIATGSMDLLRELRCAASFNQTYLDGYFSDKQLWQMANAAEATATDDVIGSLRAGRVADISIFNEVVHDAHRAVVAAEAEDVVLVMRAGEALYGDTNILASLPGIGACDPVDVCGVDKVVCLQGEIAKTYSQLQTSAGPIYPAFSCDTPNGESSCIPSRDISVNGSTVYDGDITGTDDDGDGDAKGDACDGCPSFSNPASAACPATIYDIKNGSVAIGRRPR